MSPKKFLNKSMLESAETKKALEIQKEIISVLFGCEVDNNGKKQQMSGLVEHNRNHRFLLKALQSALIAIARIVNISAEDLDNASSNDKENESYLLKLKEAGEKRTKGTEIKK